MHSYTEAKNRNIEVLIHSYYKILKEPAHRAMVECVRLIYDAAFVEFRALLNSGKSGSKPLNSIEILLDLMTSATMFLQYKSSKDIVEFDFIKSLANVLIEQTPERDNIFQLFTHYFINQTITSLSMGEGVIPSDHFEHMISQAGLMIVSHIYPSNAFAQSSDLITHIISHFKPAVNQLKSHYSILKLAVHIITADQNMPFRFISSEASKLVDAVNLFGSIRQGVPAEEVKLIIKMTQTEVQRMRDDYNFLTNKNILQSFEMTLVSLKLLSEHSGYLFDGNFEQKFIAILRSSTEFMDLSRALFIYKIAMSRSPSNKKLSLELEDYLQVLAKKSEGVVQQPAAPSSPLTANFSIVSHLYSTGNSESSSSRSLTMPANNRNVMPLPQ